MILDVRSDRKRFWDKLFGQKKDTGLCSLASRVYRSLDRYTRDFFIKTCSIITAIAFFVNILSYDFALTPTSNRATRAEVQSWAIKVSPEFPHVGSGRDDGPGEVIRLDVDEFMLPEYLGTVSERHKAGRPNGTVLLVQDAHCNYAAQKRINEIIRHLNNKYGIDTLNLEGGKGEYDLSVFTDIENKKIREKVSDYFVKEGLLSGAEYYAIQDPKRARLWGLEDTKLYLANLDVYRRSLAHKREIEQDLKVLDHILNNLKMHIYSKELLDFDKKFTAYKAENIDFRNYLEYLIESAERKNMDMEDFPNISMVKSSLDMEGKIDFKRANDERDLIIDRLHNILSRNELEELVAKTVEFESEKLSMAAFYEYLIQKAGEIGARDGEYPEIRKYVHYVSTYHAVDKTRAMMEVAELEEKLKNSLYQNRDQKKLSELSKNLALLNNIFNITLTVNDYGYYRKNEPAFGMRNYISFIRRNSPRYKIAARLPDNIGNIDKYRNEMDKFFEYSFDRDDAFLKNMKLDKETESCIIVAGGFHSDNLCSLLREKDISYLCIMPNFKCEEGYESPYLALLAGEERPMEAKLKNILTFRIAIASQLSELGPEAYSAIDQATFRLHVKWREAAAQGKGLVIQYGDRRFAISPNGEIVPADRLKSFEVANVADIAPEILPAVAALPDAKALEPAPEEETSRAEAISAREKTLSQMANLEDKIKFLAGFIAPSQANRSFRKWAYGNLFSILESEFLSISDINKKTRILRDILAYSKKIYPNDPEASDLVYKTILAFLSKISKTTFVTGESVDNMARRIAENMSPETMYVELYRGLSLAELKMIIEFGEFVNDSGYAILANAENAKSYQGEGAKDARGQGREVILKMRVPVWLVQIVLPYGDFGFVHFGDESETISDLYVKRMTTLRDQAQEYLDQNKEAYDKRREAYAENFEAKRGRRPTGGAWGPFYDNPGNARYQDAYITVKNLTGILKTIEGWDKPGKLDARFVDWEASAELNEKRFGAAESGRFQEDIMPEFAKKTTAERAPSAAPAAGLPLSAGGIAGPAINDRTITERPAVMGVGATIWRVFWISALAAIFAAVIGIFAACTPVPYKPIEISPPGISLQRGTERIRLQQEVSRLLTPVSEEDFEEMKNAPDLAASVGDLTYRAYLQMQRDQTLRSNLLDALMRANEIDPARLRELLDSIQNFAILPVPYQAMAKVEYRVIVVGRGHLARIGEAGDFINGLILVVVHEGRHVKDQLDGLMEEEGNLRNWAIEEERAYKETLYWMKKLPGYSPEEIAIQEFVTDHIRDDDYQGIVAKMVTAQPGADANRVVAIARAVVNGALSDADEFLSADPALFRWMGADGVTGETEAVDVIFKRDGVAYRAYITFDGRIVEGTRVEIISHAGFGLEMTVEASMTEELLREKKNALQDEISEGKMPPGFSKETVVIAGTETDMFIHDGIKKRLQEQGLTLQQFMENCIAIRGPTYTKQLEDGLKGRTLAEGNPLIMDFIPNSPNLYGNCLQDGYIYINSNAPAEMDIVGVSHELMHEAGIFDDSNASETELAGQDVGIMEQMGISLPDVIRKLGVVSPTNILSAIVPEAYQAFFRGVLGTETAELATPEVAVPEAVPSQAGVETEQLAAPAGTGTAATEMLSVPEDMAARREAALTREEMLSNLLDGNVPSDPDALARAVEVELMRNYSSNIFVKMLGKQEKELRETDKRKALNVISGIVLGAGTEMGEVESLGPRGEIPGTSLSIAKDADGARVELGSGTWSIAYDGKDAGAPAGSERVAVKATKFLDEYRPDLLSNLLQDGFTRGNADMQLLREIAIMKHFHQTGLEGGAPDYHGAGAFMDQDKSGRESVRYYLAMEHSGISLDKIRDLTADQFNRITVSILNALEKVHEAGILHLDIKPDNIFFPLDEDGNPDFDRAVIGDFGSSMIVDDVYDFTRVSTLYGSPRYMPPEHVSPDGRAFQVSALSDIYAVGITLDEMLSNMKATERRMVPPDMRRMIYSLKETDTQKRVSTVRMARERIEPPRVAIADDVVLKDFEDNWLQRIVFRTMKPGQSFSEEDIAREAQKIVPVITDIVGSNLEAIAGDVSEMEFGDGNRNGFKRFVVTEMEHVGSGFFKSTIKITVDTDLGRRVFAVRIFNPEMEDLTLEKARNIYGGEVDKARVYGREGLSIHLQRAYFTGVDIGAEQSGQLKEYGLYGFSVGEFIEGTTINEIADREEKKAAYREMVKAVIRLWLETFSPETGNGLVIDDLKGENMIKKKGTGEIVHLDLGFMEPSDINDIRSALSAVLIKDLAMMKGDGIRFDTSPGGKDEIYFLSAIPEALNEYLAEKGDELEEEKRAAIAKLKEANVIKEIVARSPVPRGPPIVAGQPLAEPPITGNIAAGSPSEIAAWRAEIDGRADDDTADFMERNRETVREVAQRCSAWLDKNEERLRGMLGQYGFSAGEIDTVIEALKGPAELFRWFNARVEGEEKYLLGHDKALAVNIARHLMEREKRRDVPDDLLEEYVLHEAMERLDIDHHYIIQLTTEIFNRGILYDTIKRPGLTPLGLALRDFIDVQLREAEPVAPRAPPALAEKAGMKDLDEVRAELEQRSWYFRNLTDEAKENVMERIDSYGLNKLIEVLQDEIDGEIVGVYLMGSSIWGPAEVYGFEEYKFKDLDVVVVVRDLASEEGYRNGFKSLKRGRGLVELNDVLARIYPTGKREIQKIDINLIKEEELKGELSHRINHLSASAWGSGVLVYGTNIIYPEQLPPERAMLEVLSSLLASMRSEIGQYEKLKADKAEIDRRVKKAKGWEKRDLLIEQAVMPERLRSQHLRVIKRLNEIMLVMGYFNGSYRVGRKPLETELRTRTGEIITGPEVINDFLTPDVGAREGLFGVLTMEELTRLAERIDVILGEAFAELPEAEVPAEMPRAPPVIEVTAPEELYPAAQELAPAIVDAMRRGARTYDFAPSHFEDISSDAGVSRRVQKVLGKRGHKIHAQHYSFDPKRPKEWPEKLKELVEKNFTRFYEDSLSSGATRMVIRLLRWEGVSSRAEMENFIKDLIRKRAPEMKPQEVDDFYTKHINIIEVDIGDIKHVNPVIDLFADVGMMEIDRFEKGDYKGSAPEGLNDKVARLLNLSLDGLMNTDGRALGRLTGEELYDVMKQMFLGNVYLVIRKIDWESVKDRIKAEEAVLRAL